MLPEFIRLGYNQNEFLLDYAVNKLKEEEVANIKKHFSTNILFKKVYNAKAIDLFIGKYFAAKACPNNSFDYKERLNKLNKIDPELFQILEAFLTEWKIFDYNDTDPITGSYHLFLFDFIDKLEKWANEKTIK